MSNWFHRRYPHGLLGLFLLASYCVQAAHLEQGPMLGHVGSQEIRVWVRASAPASLGLMVSPSSNMEGATLYEGPSLEVQTDFNGHVRATGLTPSTRYHYAVVLDGKPVMSAPYPSVMTAPLEGTPTHLRFAFGSCVGHQGSLAAAAWGQMASDPSIELLLMLGDNHYADSTDPDVQRAAYYDHRGVAGFRALSSRSSVIGIWDDHDFGPNDSDRTAEGRSESLRTFQSMWANLAYGQSDHPGIYHHFQRGDIDFFMLDDRYYRWPNRSEDHGDKTMLGARQWAWLKSGLKASKAKLKFIASGSEWQKNGHLDSWTSFRREQLAFFEWLESEQIEGVILLSGDRHFTGGYQINQRVIEITSGPLGSNNYATPNLPEMFLNHGEGKLYCVFDIDTRDATPKVVLEVHRAGEGLIDRRDFTMDEINGKARLATLPVRQPAPEMASESDLPLIRSDRFEQGAGSWLATDQNAWRIMTQDGSKVYSLHRQSAYRPPHRSPVNISRLKDVVVGDFDLLARVLTTQRDYGHRDMCLFFGWQDPEHFYYVHLGQAMDDHANQIFIVNQAPRVKISEHTTQGTPWDAQWHTVKISRRVASGSIHVYWDDMETPVMRATDRTFLSGQIGLGSFDDTGNWDDVRLYGQVLEP
jgi:alkaline phosphatase D